MASIKLTDKQRISWLRLTRAEGVGPRSFRALIARFGTAESALEALPAFRRKGKEGYVPSQAEAEDEMARALGLGVTFLALGEEGYPKALRAIESAPPLMGVRGHISVLSKHCVGIVGSRNASAGGLKLAERFARDIGEHGCVIVSGLARGIDTRAHGASLLTGTVAVLAGGHDRLYPKENEKLLEQILERGAVVSEMPMGCEPRGRDFPRRNRIISGLSLGVVVVEAALRSGSLVTARFALEQNRDVFSVPGSPLDPRSEGTNELLRQGAHFCTTAEHVISQLNPAAFMERLERDGVMEETRASGVMEQELWDELEGLDVLPPPSALIDLFDETHGFCEAPHNNGFYSQQDVTQKADWLLELLSPVPMSVDDVVRASKLPVAQVLNVLFELEVCGKIQRHSSGSVMRCV
jgi:DNA processing protein